MADHSTDKNDKSTATVEAIVQESPTIKRLVLHIEDRHVTFKAGQWVDFFIPGMTVFTGFSMCSSPSKLKDSGTLELAIKYSDYPPTDWVHTQCKVGDQVQIKVSGPFFYDPSPQDDDPSDLLLLAAGIGINPIHSIYQHYVDLDGRQSQGKVALLYSAKNCDELVFKEGILQTSTEVSKVHVQLFSTSTSQHLADDTHPVTNRRIRAEDIRNAMAELNMDTTKVFMCGPSPFIDDMEKYCLVVGLRQSQIHYEKWW